MHHAPSEKKVNETLTDTINHLQAIRSTLNDLLQSVDVALQHKSAGESVEGFSFHEARSFDWPKLLDSLLACVGQFLDLARSLDKTGAINLQNLQLVPIALSPDFNASLAQLTQNRVTKWDHTVVPPYFGSQKEPEIDMRHHELYQRAALVNKDHLQKQAQQLNKVCSSVYEAVSKAQTEWESDFKDKNQNKGCNDEDTIDMLLAMKSGKGLNSD